MLRQILTSYELQELGLTSAMEADNDSNGAAKLLRSSVFLKLRTFYWIAWQLKATSLAVVYFLFPYSVSFQLFQAIVGSLVFVSLEFLNAAQMDGTIRWHFDSLSWEILSSHLSLVNYLVGTLDVAVIIVAYSEGMKFLWISMLVTYLCCHLLPRVIGYVRCQCALYNSLDLWSLDYFIEMPRNRCHPINKRKRRQGMWTVFFAVRQAMTFRNDTSLVNSRLLENGCHNSYVLQGAKLPKFRLLLEFLHMCTLIIRPQKLFQRRTLGRSLDFKEDLPPAPLELELTCSDSSSLNSSGECSPQTSQQYSRDNWFHKKGNAVVQLKPISTLEELSTLTTTGQLTQTTISTQNEGAVEFKCEIPFKADSTTQLFCRIRNSMNQFYALTRTPDFKIQQLYLQSVILGCPLIQYRLREEYMPLDFVESAEFFNAVVTFIDLHLYSFTINLAKFHLLLTGSKNIQLVLASFLLSVLHCSLLFSYACYDKEILSEMMEEAD